MGEKMNVALLGVGRWGTHLLRNLLTDPQTRVMAIADPCSDRLSALATTLSCRSTEQEPLLSSDWQSVLNLPDLDAVIVATPAVTHYSLIRSALEQGLHVLAEKPLTLTVSEAQELCQIALQQQCQLVVDHTYLFHPAIQRGRRAVQAGQLGDLRYGYAARTHLGPVRYDVDALWDLAIHDIAIFNNWLNQTPVQVQAQGSVWLQLDTSLPIATTSTGLSDLVWVRLTYPSGFQATIHLCWANADKQRRLSIVGSRGTLTFDELAPTPLTLFQGRLEGTDRLFTPVDQHHRILECETIEPLQAVCAHFLNCVQANSPSQISSGWVGAELVAVLAALTQSMEQGGVPVDLLP
ncbi:Gfo/Idh/MocA family protein [Thermocoleostomius sinensis]|uniref:Gfo/Idh/MocA family oxidoreductase n=1 Tax=Thermocoleostomius sinensis A174 TaxID=2016057 RepID=A0A9E8ZHQ4_9CYAN|nr:Gfo/Idh/MocA family oxidoreductase [Thermocoleostomius sinensis]WAL61947.1 Gfo/Idh/MocA family oxidoreductase [Thermocoleostomius sinensis A174]